jgi:putative aldouronate transport system permease protein
MAFLSGFNFSFATAIGLFNNVINMVMLLIVNFIAKKVGETSLF